MLSRTIMLVVVIMAFSMVAALSAESDSSSPVSSEGKTSLSEYERLSGELKLLEDALPAKKAELVRLHRKWVLAKGRMPSTDEVREFTDKQAKGEVKVEDNPYVNKSPLSSVGRYREAYFKKQNEIKGDEERVARLKAEIARLKHQAYQTETDKPLKAPGRAGRASPPPT